MKVVTCNFLDPSVISRFLGAKNVLRTLRIRKKKENTGTGTTGRLTLLASTSGCAP